MTTPDNITDAAILNAVGFWMAQMVDGQSSGDFFADHTFQAVKLNGHEDWRHISGDAGFYYGMKAGAIIGAHLQREPLSDIGKHVRRALDAATEEMRAMVVVGREEEERA